MLGITLDLQHVRSTVLGPMETHVSGRPSGLPTSFCLLPGQFLDLFSLHPETRFSW